MADIM